MHVHVFLSSPAPATPLHLPLPPHSPRHWPCIPAPLSPFMSRHPSYPAPATPLHLPLPPHSLYHWPCIPVPPTQHLDIIHFSPTTPHNPSNQSEPLCGTGHRRAPQASHASSKCSRQTATSKEFFCFPIWQYGRPFHAG